MLQQCLEVLVLKVYVWNLHKGIPEAVQFAISGVMGKRSRQLMVAWKRMLRNPCNSWKPGTSRL